MATCDWCGQEMLSAASCSVRVFHRGGTAYPLPPHGEERRFGGSLPVGRRCHDCGVEPGAFHHPGCDMAECPDCRGQMLSCGCRFDEDGPGDDDDEWECADDSWEALGEVCARTKYPELVASIQQYVVSASGQMSLPAAVRHRWSLEDGGPVDVIDLGFGVLTVPAGAGPRLLGDVLTAEEHAAYVRSLEGDADLATT